MSVRQTRGCQWHHDKNEKINNINKNDSEISTKRKGKKIKIPGLIMSIISVLGVVIIIRMQGSGDVNPLYPVILWSFFLVTPNTALAIGILAMALTAPLVMGQMDSFIFAKFVSSMLGCMLFAYTFATLRNRQRDELFCCRVKMDWQEQGIDARLMRRWPSSLSLLAEIKQTSVCWS